MSHRRHQLIALAFLACLAGCGTQSAPETPAPAPDSKSRVSGPAAPAPGVNGAAASVLRFAQGSWVSSCRNVPFRPPYRSRLAFSGMSVTHESSIYQDSRCRQLLLTWSRQLTVTTVHRADPDEEDDTVELELDVHTNTVTMTTFNGYGPLSGHLCGLPAWTDGNPRDVSGRDCGPGHLDAAGRPSTLYLKHDPTFGALEYENDSLKRQ